AAAVDARLVTIVDAVAAGGHGAIGARGAHQVVGGYLLHRGTAASDEQDQRHDRYESRGEDGGSKAKARVRHGSLDVWVLGRYPRGDGLLPRHRSRVARIRRGPHLISQRRDFLGKKKVLLARRLRNETCAAGNVWPYATNCPARPLITTAPT